MIKKILNTISIAIPKSVMPPISYIKTQAFKNKQTEIKINT